MKNLILSFITFLLLCLPAQAQSIQKFVDPALGYLQVGNTANFERIYTQLYPLYLKANLPEYASAMEAVGNGDFEESFDCLRELIGEDLFLDEIPADPDFTPLHSHPHWAGFLHEVESRRAGYENELRLQLKRIQYRDQGIRILYMLTGDDYMKKEVHRYMKTVDSQSAEEVRRILDRYGWLRPEVIGSEANETLFLAIQHVDDLKVQKDYLPLLQNAVRRGDAEGWQLAFLTDRILMNQGKKQIYGTQKIVSREPGKSFIVPLQYPEHVDRLRAEAGMETLGEELEEEGLKWDLEEYLRDLPRIERKYEEYHKARNGD